jgi:hypothetical protein
MATQWLSKSARLVGRANIVAYVNSCEDLAQTYFQNQQYDLAEQWLELAEDAIPREYRVGKGTELRDVPVERCVEGLWWQLSKIHRLRGYLVFQRAQDDGSGQVSPGALAQAMHHDDLSRAYSSKYSRLAMGGANQSCPVTRLEEGTVRTA